PAQRSAGADTSGQVAVASLPSFSVRCLCRERASERRRDLPQCRAYPGASKGKPELLRNFQFYVTGSVWTVPVRASPVFPRKDRSRGRKPAPALAA
ncbi:hypothetical protein DV515_00012744, partial [Chloebia gouldiae]